MAPLYHSNPLPLRAGWAIPYILCAELKLRVALTRNSPATFMYSVVRRRPLKECIGSAVASVASSEKDAPVGIRAFWQAAQDVRATASAASSTDGTLTKRTRTRRSNESIIRHALLRAFHHFLSGASWAALSFAAPSVRVHVCVRCRWFWRSAGRRSHGSLSAGSHDSVATLNNSRGDTPPPAAHLIVVGDF